MMTQKRAIDRVEKPSKERRHIMIEDALSQGRSLPVIVRTFSQEWGVAPRTVYRDVTMVKRYWRDVFQDVTDEERADQLEEMALNTYRQAEQDKFPDRKAQIHALRFIAELRGLMAEDGQHGNTTINVSVIQQLAQWYGFRDDGQDR